MLVRVDAYCGNEQNGDPSFICINPEMIVLAKGGLRDQALVLSFANGQQITIAKRQWIEKAARQSETMRMLYDQWFVENTY